MQDKIIGLLSLALVVLSFTDCVINSAIARVNQWL